MNKFDKRVVILFCILSLLDIGMFSIYWINSNVSIIFLVSHVVFLCFSFIYLECFKDNEYFKFALNELIQLEDKENPYYHLYQYYLGTEECDKELLQEYHLMKSIHKPKKYLKILVRKYQMIECTNPFCSIFFEKTLINL